MKFTTHVAILACLIATVLCQYIWDASRMVEFAADPNFQQICENRGNDLTCAMRSSDWAAGLQLQDTRAPASAQSMFIPGRGLTWATALRIWYWFKVAPRDIACDFSILGWTQTLIDIGAGTQQYWSCTRYVHQNPDSGLSVIDQHYPGPWRGPNGPYTATGADIEVAMSRYGGTLLFESTLTPKVAATLNWRRNAQNPVRDIECPELRLASDFLWAEWKDNENRLDMLQNVRYMGCLQVSDYITLKLIARYLLLNGLPDLEPWPGTLFQGDSREALALSATPCGKLVSLFLIQHKQWLALKHVASVKVFRGPPNAQNKYYPQLLFEIQDVPANMVKPDPTNFPIPARPAPPPVPPPDAFAPPRRPLPLNPQPVIPGPSTPRPSPARFSRKDSVPSVAHQVRQEGKGDEFLRVHTFHIL